MNRRVLAVDPGDKRIGIAVSDETGTIANPLTVIMHSARLIDAAAIVQLAVEQGAGIIVVGQPLDSEGEPGPQARHAMRLADAIRSQTELAVVLVDESGSTQTAREARWAMGARRRDRAGHLDEIAAAVILQSYLDLRDGIG
jgi:putative holliday junction resolvase